MRRVKKKPAAKKLDDAALANMKIWGDGWYEKLETYLDTKVTAADKKVLGVENKKVKFYDLFILHAIQIFFVCILHKIF